MQTRLAAVAFLLIAAGGAIARPLMLIYQDQYPSTRQSDANVSIVAHIARELDSSGKAIPIIYDPSSTLIKAALQSGKLKNAPATPAPDKLAGIAKALTCKYILVVKARRNGDVVETEAALSPLGGKIIWAKKQSFTAGGTHTDADPALVSAGRTIALQIASDPLRNEGSGPDLPPPEPGRGTENTTPPAPPESQPWKDGLAAFQAGDYPEAASLLRNAVDRDPLNPEIRATLAKTYSQLGMASYAVEECVRALRLIPDDASLRVVQARALMQLGRGAEGEAVLRSVLDKDKNNIEATVGLAEILIARQNTDAAVTLYRQARQLAPKDADIAWALSEALALSGDYDGSLRERDAAVALGLPKDGPSADARYHRIMDIVSAALTQLGKEATAAHADAVKSKTETIPDLGARIAAILGRANSLSAYLEQLGHPTQHDVSHARRVFGANLLSQAILALKDDVEQGRTDALDEAVLNRTEALRELNGAAKLYAEERAKEKTPK